MLAMTRPTLLSFVFFAEGSGAAASGDPSSANPYQPGTIQHDRWQDGWNLVMPAPATVATREATN